MGTVELEKGTALEFHTFMYKVILSWDRRTLIDYTVSNYMLQIICIKLYDVAMEWFGQVSHCRLLIWRGLISGIWNHSWALNQKQSGLQGSSACMGHCLNYSIKWLLVRWSGIKSLFISAGSLTHWSLRGWMKLSCECLRPRQSPIEHC